MATGDDIRIEGVTLKEFIEAVLDEQRRGMVVAEQEREKSAAALRNDLERQITVGDFNLKEYFNGLLKEKERALDKASEEREKSAEVLRDEKNRAAAVAEQEREKSAKTLREELSRSISEGDNHLQLHIQEQIVQIRAALDAQARLDAQQFESFEKSLGEVVKASMDRTVNLRNEMRLLNESSDKAILKAETSTEKRFESVNEFRAQLADQSNTFLPREVAETNFKEMRNLITDLTNRLNVKQGSDTGREKQQDTSSRTVGIAIAAAGMIIGFGGLIAAIIANAA